MCIIFDIGQFFFFFKGKRLFLFVLTYRDKFWTNQHTMMIRWHKRMRNYFQLFIYFNFLFFFYLSFHQVLNLLCKIFAILDLSSTADTLSCCVTVWSCINNGGRGGGTTGRAGVRLWHTVLWQEVLQTRHLERINPRPEKIPLSGVPVMFLLFVCVCVSWHLCPQTPFKSGKHSD